ncbi:MAG: amidohydrolase [Anaerolineales bacterium]|nr:amidohydrolase [Chloroflexota bacterium]MBL6983171.1 amidohydrolase [Anaerolineales bacterium]
MTNILIINGSILAENGWVDPGFLCIREGKIRQIGAGTPSPGQIDEAKEVLDARHCAILPGLTNAHTHLSQTFMRGLAGGRTLIDWLKDVIWPIQAVISPEEMYLAALLGLVENLRCGAIRVTDHHKITGTPAHTNEVLKAAREVSLRFTLARSWSDRGKNPESLENILSDFRRLFDLSRDDDHIEIANGPLALWRCSEGALQATHQLVLEHGAFTHFHVSESQDEVQMSLDEYDLRPVEWLETIGVLGPDTQIVHAVWVDDDEIKLIADANAQVIHCPVSNAVLGSGVAPVAQMLGHGVDILLGTDGPASNDTQDIWETLKGAVNFARATSLNPTILPPSQALKLATGGKTLRVNDPADVIVVNLDHSRVVPVQDINSALVLGTHGSDVQTVIVGGEILMKNGNIAIVDEKALYDECRDAIQSLRKRAEIS